jgi:chromosome segregation ATPase
MSLLRIQNRVETLEQLVEEVFKAKPGHMVMYDASKVDPNDLCPKEEDLSDKIMSLEQRIEQLEQQLLAEAERRDADWKRIEELEHQIDLLKQKKKPGRPRKYNRKKLGDEDFD